MRLNIIKMYHIRKCFIIELLGSGGLGILFPSSDDRRTDIPALRKSIPAQKIIPARALRAWAGMIFFGQEWFSSGRNCQSSDRHWMEISY